MLIGTNVVELWPKLVHAIKSEVKCGILISLTPYFWLFYWSPIVLYKLAFWAAAWLARPLVWPWHLLGLSMKVSL